MERGGIVYILTNISNNILYTGVTSDLQKRIIEHREKKYKDSFTTKYNINKLVYYKFFSNIDEAIAEEKRIKAGSRKQKIQLIESMNLQWKDLWEDVSKW